MGKIVLSAALIAAASLFTTLPLQGGESPVKHIDRDPYTDGFFKTPELAPSTMTGESGPRSYGADLVARIGGRELAYRMAMEEILIRDRGVAKGSLFSTSYVVRSDTPSRRPVMFAFNGGPGAASLITQYAFGPRRLQSHDPARSWDADNGLVDNEHSLLDIADLVFIDPADTGFSKTLPDAEPTTFHSRETDSASVAALIHHWLSAHGRLDSPVYVMGESFGSNRAVVVTRDLARSTPAVRVKGIVMAGTSLTLSLWGRAPNPMLLANRVPMMASVAWHYGKIDNRNQTWEQAVQRAREFARDTYLPALMQGYALDRETFDRIVTQLPRVIGIPESYFRRHGKITVSGFNAELLKAEGRVLDRNNGLASYPAGETQPGYQETAYRRTFQALARETLGVPESLGEFLLINPDVGRQWISTPVAGAPGLDVVLEDIFASDPDIRLLVMQGRYDTLTDLGVTEHMIHHTKLPPQRRSIAYYDGGHAIIPTAEAMGAVRGFLAGPGSNGGSR